MMSSELKPYPEYKGSGVEWLGEVPVHWEVRRWKTLCSRSAIYGANITAISYSQRGVRFIRTTDIDENGGLKDGGVYLPEELVRDYLLTDGDILVSRSGTVGRSFMYDRSIHGLCSYAGYLVRFVPSCTALSSYIFLFTKTPAFSSFLRMNMISSTIGNVNGEKYANCQLPLPPLPEQAAIVRFLDHADRRIRRSIRAKEKLIALLEEQKQVVIHQAVTGRIDVRTRKPYPAYKDTDAQFLGPIPSHWNVSRLGKVMDLTVGFPFKSEGFTQSEEDIRLLRGINVSPGRLRWDDVVRWPASDASNYVEFRLSVGDIILGMDRPIIGSGTRVAMVSESDVPSLLLQRVARIRPIEEKLTRKFAMRLLSGTSFSDYLTPIFTGISVPHLSPEQIRGFPVALPSLAEQEAIGIYLDSIAGRITRTVSSARTQISGMHEYRTRLIADVVTGKLDVREAAVTLPDDPDGPEEPDDPDAAETDCAEPEGGDDSHPHRDRRTEVPATQREIMS